MTVALPKVPAKRLRTLVDRFAGKTVLVCGDVMLDRYIRGKVSRISPEAPVPVVQVDSETHVPGGAGNVCNNLSALGAKVVLITAVGDDAAGETLLTDLRGQGVDTRWVTLDRDRATTQKCRVIGDHQQLLRFDRETVESLKPKVQQAIARTLADRVGSAQALVVSDYGKGVVTPEVLKTGIRAARQARIPVTVDPKIEHFRRYRGVDCITPNMNEAWAGMRAIPRADEVSVRDLGWRILKTLRAASVLITRGEKGMTLFENKRPPHSLTHIPAQAQEVFDVTGAGDTVISVLSLALACGATKVEAAMLANRAAGIVVGKLGTATVSPDELRAALR